ncbi:uncharacterized protein LOC125489515 [Plutella xylostella]|uniref:uncharacterized protein LOC125489515 n=1 Tax=Plutella xylostella TaxID=51655 RepID=UPI002032FE20|nr:uncharacterized protein LOC125489515 [Plutella xylostella]
MKILLVFLLVSVCVANRIDEEEKDEKHDKKQIIPGYNIPEINQEFREQDRDIYRPCNFFDLLCIRRYLSRHSTCKIAIGSVPDPLYRAQSTTYYPTFNVSVVQNELFIGNANGFIREF